LVKQPKHGSVIVYVISLVHIIVIYTLIMNTFLIYLQQV